MTEQLDQQRISNAEWEVMRVVWANEPLTSRAIIDYLQQSFDWKEGTIKSLLSRLVQKRALAKDDSCTPYLFKSLVSNQALTQMQLDSLMHYTCSKQRGEHLAYLIETNTLSQAQCQSLITALTHKASNAPIDIPCDCPPGQCACHRHIAHHSL